MRVCYAFLRAIRGTVDHLSGFATSVFQLQSTTVAARFRGKLFPRVTATVRSIVEGKRMRSGTKYSYVRNYKFLSLL